SAFYLLQEVWTSGRAAQLHEGRKSLPAAGLSICPTRGRCWRSSWCDWLFAHKQGQAGEVEESSGVIDHADRAGVGAGFKLGEGNIELEDGGFGLGGGVLAGLHQGCLEDLDLSTEELNAGQQVDWILYG